MHCKYSIMSVETTIGILKQYTIFFFLRQSNRYSKSEKLSRWVGNDSKTDVNFHSSVVKLCVKYWNILILITNVLYYPLAAIE